MRQFENPAPAGGGLLQRHVPALDGVRGVAVLGVMLAHVYTLPASTHWGSEVQGFLHFAGVGVVLFFVLSGFLITGILVDSVGDPHFFRNFYLRRVLRIAPLYYGVLLVFAATVWWGGKQYGHELISLALYLQNTSVLTPQIWYYEGPSQLPLLHFWTLAVEEQFYLVWPLLISVLVSRRNVFRACVMGALLSLVLRFVLVTHGRVAEDVHGMTICRLDTLLGGGALAMLVESRWRAAVLRSAAWLLSGGLVLALLCDHAGRFVPHSYVVGSSAYTLSFLAYSLACVGFVALALRPEGEVSRLLRWMPLRRLGRYSYGLYVFHYIFLGLWGSCWRAWLQKHGSGSAAMAVFLTGSAIVAVSLLAAIVSYELYEKPFLRLKRLLPYAEGTAKAAVSTR
ncbi:MAG: acyltransferase [Acidobacteriaceae bacterium]|nr:acyltransferase [Acidobacteriaceae bacterium]